MALLTSSLEPGSASAYSRRKNASERWPSICWTDFGSPVSFSAKVPAVCRRSCSRVVGGRPAASRSGFHSRVA
jgi:hypothetical protein